MVYGQTLRAAHDAGVVILPYHCKLDPLEKTVEIMGRLPYIQALDEPPKIESKRKARPAPDRLIQAVGAVDPLVHEIKKSKRKNPKENRFEAFEYRKGEV